MISKAQNKYIRSLTQQKYRKEYNAFIAEGDKIAREWLNSNAPIQIIVALEGWAQQHEAEINRHKEATLCIVTEQELEKISELQMPNQVLLVVNMPEQVIPVITGWCIALDGLQDPGNMGTIIRIADWFGIKQIICSQDCADVYNPKVIQAAMGGHLRVQLFKTDLYEFLSGTSLPIYAAALDGDSIYQMQHPAAGIIVIGNESKGISKPIIEIATHKITIPRIGGAESLNAAVSAGIICALLAGR